MKFIIYSTILFLCLTACCLPAQGQKQQRIKQIWHYDADSALNGFSDSIIFYYSGKRGSIFKPHKFNTTDFGYRYDNAANGSIYPAWDMPDPVYDLFQQDVLCDSTYRFSRFKGSVVRQLQVTRTSYQNDTQAVRLLQYTDGDTTASNVRTYNDLGLPSDLYEFYYNPISMHQDTATSRHIYYNTDKKVLADSTFSPDISTNSYLKYTYDAKGRLASVAEIQPTPVPINRIYRIDYTYDDAGNVVRIINSYLDEDVFVTVSIEMLEYDIQNRLVSHKYYDAGSQQVPQYIHTVQYNGDGDPYIQETQYYGGNELTGCERVEFYFNKYHNPDSAISISGFCRSALTHKEVTLFTYETYNGDILVIKHRPIIYPNPANDIVHIKWNTYQGKVPVQLYLYNTTGQQVRSYNIPKQSAIDDIDIKGLRAGIYILRIYTVLNEELYTGKLVVY